MLTSLSKKKTHVYLFFSFKKEKCFIYDQSVILQLFYHNSFINNQLEWCDRMRS